MLSWKPRKKENAQVASIAEDLNTDSQDLTSGGQRCNGQGEGWEGYEKKAQLRPVNINAVSRVGEFSKWVPSASITWELGRNALSQNLPQTH